MILRTKDHRLTPDSEAALAIVGMRGSKTTDRVLELEKEYQQWLGVEVDLNNLVIKQEWRTQKLLWLMQRFKAFRIFRQQVTILANAFSKSQSDQAATDQQLSFHTEYLRMVAAQRELSSFLAAHYPHHLAAAQTANIPLLRVALEIMSLNVPK